MKKVKISVPKNLIPRKIRILMRNKAKISKSILVAKTGARVSSLKSKLHHLEDELKSHYDKRRDAKEYDAISKIKKNPKFFYSFAKKFSVCKSSIGPFLNSEEDIVDDNFQMAEMLKIQYEKSFSNPLASAIVEDGNNFFNVENFEISGSCPNIFFNHQEYTS